MGIDREPDDDIEADARRMIVRALNRDPFDVWTRDSLARSLGVSSWLTAKILAELASAGMVHRVDATGDGYTVAGDDELLV
jgi:DNA-binding IscR family transcriptional regulator